MPSVSALEIGAFNLDAHGVVGSNVTQGVYYGLGLDFYTYVEDRLAVGIGGYYTAGQHPSQDRQIGAGPFVSSVCIRRNILNSGESSLDVCASGDD